MSRGWAPDPPAPVHRRAVRHRTRRSGGDQTGNKTTPSIVERDLAQRPTQTPAQTPARQRALRWLAGRLADREGSPQGDTSSRPDGVPAELAAEAVRRHLPVHSPQAAAEQMLAMTDDLTGLGPLAPWARTPGVTDVLVDGSGVIWTDGPDGLQDTGRRLSAQDSRRLAVRLLSQGGRRLDEGRPFGDAQVTGARVHAILPPVASGGTQISVRLPASDPPTLEDLARGWPHGEVWSTALRLLLQTRANVLISGATGSGKTTLLSALLSEVPDNERLITVEDTRELRPRHPHVVSLEARAGNSEGAGGISLAELVRQALRMRPDRLVVGECRGAEVMDFLAAMNTGHRGAAGTLHANSAADVPARLLAMGALAGLGVEAVTLQAASAVDAVLHLERTEAGRHPVELCLVERAAGGRPGGSVAGQALRLVPAWSMVGMEPVPGPGRALLDALGGGGRRGRHAGEDRHALEG